MIFQTFRETFAPRVHPQNRPRSTAVQIRVMLVTRVFDALESISAPASHDIVAALAGELYVMHLCLHTASSTADGPPAASRRKRNAQILRAIFNRRPECCPRVVLFDPAAAIVFHSRCKEFPKYSIYYFTLPLVMLIKSKTYFLPPPRGSGLLCKRLCTD